ncbi:NAD-dependent epimerase/dehydratase family protein [Martelella alba]|uniref:NAD-dependent epimerase/dehydratase family protein n=1 Tax=Martelella alba TaxID=2590451 RepID=A0A506U144_9HYPH|nr:NAD-dependent epimerase/dehydratase family protein [Martelella alba]TPW27490.1 NAD-dependent epimerase/dehydratase family protein [Martelella alba]
MTDTVLLTGITGFLGGHIALELLNRGYSVRGSLRNPGPDGARVKALGETLQKAGADVSRLETVTLDLMSDAGWDEAARGARFMIHSASPFVTTMPKDPDQLVRPAVEGTERAMRAAGKAGIERVVLTSSTAAIVYGRGPGRPDHLGSDDWPDPAEGRLAAYALSKNLAERRAWELAEDPSRLAVINPGFIVGPLLDADPGTSGAIFQRLLRGEFPMMPRLAVDIVDVRDAATLHVNALTDAEAAGKRHLSAFAGLWMKDLAAIAARAAPAYAKKISTRQAPDWLVRLLALFDGDIRANVNELGYHPALDSERAKRLLGRTPYTAEDSVSDMVKSIVARGLV